jgi:hypothetical protein
MSHGSDEIIKTGINGVVLLAVTKISNTLVDSKNCRVFDWNLGKG